MRLKKYDYMIKALSTTTPSAFIKPIDTKESSLSSWEDDII